MIVLGLLLVFLTHLPSAQQAATYEWEIHDNTNCFPTSGAEEHACCGRSVSTFQTFETCQQLCIDTEGCDGITFSAASFSQLSENDEPRRCFLRHNTVIDECEDSSSFMSAKLKTNLGAYLEASSGSSSCPDGFSIVVSEFECENNAAQILNKPYNRADCWNDNEFTGCFSNNNYVYFSTCVGTSSNGNRSPVCKVETTSPDTTSRTCEPGYKKILGNPIAGYNCASPGITCHKNSHNLTPQECAALCTGDCIGYTQELAHGRCLTMVSTFNGYIRGRRAFGTEGFYCRSEKFKIGYYFTVIGDCEFRGNCVSSAGYPGVYGDNGECTIDVLRDVSVSVGSTFNVEITQTIQGESVRHRSQVPNSLNAGDSFTWTTDGFDTRDGWQLCFSEPSEIELIASGKVCNSVRWTNLYNLGHRGCFDHIMSIPECSHEFINYADAVPRGDRNCGCIVPGTDCTDANHQHDHMAHHINISIYRRSECKDYEGVFARFGDVEYTCSNIAPYASEDGCASQLHHPELELGPGITSNMYFKDICPFLYKDICQTTCASEFTSTYSVHQNINLPGSNIGECGIFKDQADIEKQCSANQECVGYTMADPVGWKGQRPIGRPDAKGLYPWCMKSSVNALPTQDTYRDYYHDYYQKNPTSPCEPSHEWTKLCDDCACGTWDNVSESGEKFDTADACKAYAENHGYDHISFKNEVCLVGYGIWCSETQHASGFETHKLTVEECTLDNIMNFLDDYIPGNRNNWNGEVGFQFIAKQDFTITHLGRGSGGTLNENADVTLWDVSTERRVARVSVGPGSRYNDNYHFEPLSEPLLVTRGTTYRITQACITGMTPWYDGTPPSTFNWNDEIADIERGVFSRGSGQFPNQGHDYVRWVSMVTFYSQTEYDCESFLRPSNWTEIQDSGSIIGEHWNRFECEYQCNIRENCVAFLSEQRVENGETYCWMWSMTGDDLIGVNDVQSEYVSWEFCLKPQSDTTIWSNMQGFETIWSNMQGFESICSKDEYSIDIRVDQSLYDQQDNCNTLCESVGSVCVDGWEDDQEERCSVEILNRFGCSRLSRPDKAFVCQCSIIDNSLESKQESKVINYDDCTSIVSSTGRIGPNDPWPTECPANTAVVSVETKEVEIKDSPSQRKWTIMRMQCCGLVDKVMDPSKWSQIPQVIIDENQRVYTPPLPSGGPSSVEEQWFVQCGPNAIIVGIKDDDSQGLFTEPDAVKCNALDTLFTSGEKIDHGDCAVVNLSPNSKSSCPPDYAVVGIYDDAATQFQRVRKMKCCRVLESILPTVSPTQMPTTDEPSHTPTVSPTTNIPSTSPTTEEPTIYPSQNPTTDQPTYTPSVSPSTEPTKFPSTSPTTDDPTLYPSQNPTTEQPTYTPSVSPSTAPTKFPSTSPSQTPTTDQPTYTPSVSPSTGPTKSPSTSPTTEDPTAFPSTAPTNAPTVCEPTCRSHSDQMMNILGRLLVYIDRTSDDPLKNELSEMLLDFHSLQAQMEKRDDERSIFSSVY